MLEAFGTAISIQRYAQVAELVDAHGSGPCAFGCGGSSPLLGTNIPQKADHRKMVGFLFYAFGKQGL